jgi:ketosteroid isomerase-like protein
VGDSVSRNIDIVSATVEAYEAEDFDALRSMLQPDVELHEWPEGPDQRVYHGVDGIFQAREEWGKAWEELRAETHGYVDAGDRVFVFIRTVGTGRGSNIEVAVDSFGVYTIRDSKVAKVEYFTDREGALAAAGLTEEDIRQEAT